MKLIKIWYLFYIYRICFSFVCFVSHVSHNLFISNETHLSYSFRLISLSRTVKSDVTIRSLNGINGRSVAVSNRQFTDLYQRDPKSICVQYWILFTPKKKEINKKTSIVLIKKKEINEWWTCNIRVFVILWR